MTKVYVTATCPDCSEVKKRLSGNPDFEIIDICEHVRNLKEFIRLRDSSPAFDSVRAGGSIGIPCFVEDDGQISFDAAKFLAEDDGQISFDGAKFLAEEIPTGASCSLDGKGC